MDRITITCKYSCNECGIHQAEIEVPARETECVMTWMNKTLQPAIRNDHRARSPNCKADSCQDLMIPVEHSDRIGGPPVN